MKKKAVSLLLAFVLALGLTVPAMAYTTPDFSDVPSNHWAYESVMKMADAGVIKGTGNGEFSPEMKLSAEMFIVLVGRVVFPEVKADGSDWSGPYVTEAKAKGLLEGTNITDSNLTGDISRYDMAVILAKCVELLKVSATKADSSKVTDYGEVPAKYIDAVLMAYGSGLIQGDQTGSFNGTNSMTRQEAATVMDRLLGLKGSSQGETTEPDQPSNATYHLQLVGSVVDEGVLVVGERALISCTTRPNATGLAHAPYGQDRRGFVCTSSNPSVVQVERNSDNWSWSLTALALGASTITLTDPYGVSEAMNITVVAQRENIGTKAYTVRVDLRSQKHTIRGDAYTETTYLFDTPFKVYYTRDGGKTSQLVAEGRTPVDDERFWNSTAELEIALPEDAFYSKDAGLYVSAEAELDGQRIVTSDLRTDGRTNIRATQQISEIKDTQGNIESRIPITATLTPPEGEKSHFTFKGYVMGDQREIVGGATVRLYHKDGFLIGETTSRENGTFEMECEVDALDGGFDKREALYRVVAWGYAGEVYGATNGIRADGSLVLKSLVDLEVASAFNSDSPGGQNYRLIIYWGATPINPE